jgi:hypothetical protein
MADFVAVIRRAVDGLTENTPELRARVYEKARGAVVRQLENMKPRPPEAMFQRQIDKLDAAIRQVEEENSEAQPPEAPAEAAAPPETQPVAVASQQEPVETTAEHVEELAPAETVHAAAGPVPLEAVYATNPVESTRFETNPAAVARDEMVHADPAVAVEVQAEPVHVEPSHPETTSFAPVEVHDDPVRAFAAEQEVHSEPVKEAEADAHPQPVRAVEPEAAHDDGSHLDVAEQSVEPEQHEFHAEPSDGQATAYHPAEPEQLEAAPFEEVAHGQQPVPEGAVHHDAPRDQEDVAYHDDPVRRAETHRDIAAEHAAESYPASVQENAPAKAPLRHAEIDDDPLLSHFEPVREPAIRHASNRVMEQPLFETESEFPGGDAEEPQPVEQHQAVAVAPESMEYRPAVQQVAAAPSWDVDIDREPEQAPEEPAAEAPMPRAALTETDVANDFSDFLKTEFAKPAVEPPPARKEPESEFSWDAPFDDLPELPKPVAFEEALHARQEAMARAPEPRAPERKAAQPQDARSELEDLIGYAAPDATIRVGADADRAAPDMARAMSKLEGKSFRVHKKNKRRFNPLPIAFGIGAALVVAGGAYGVYAYRDDVSALVASLMSSEKTPATTDTRAVAEKPADQAAEKPAEVAKTETAKAEETATKPAAADEQPTEVASLDSNIVPTKFTQRLMADGSEAETDAAKIPVDQSLSEGKTIAGQTELASADPAVKAADKKAETPGLTVTQKMFLYEERLGDSPLAVPGTVSWALKSDTTGAGGKEQPMVEATVEVPERKLKAIVSFKRNTDPSLPASHIVEVVFDLPEDFPEGNVESVQRIAFKQTEQDRGNSLIAVPAKITDDFHMIALNDDADARKVNTELMKTRSWIDIPIVYRNNRRALITFEKGSTGTEAFDKAMAEWAALGPTATGN